MILIIRLFLRVLFGFRAYNRKVLKTKGPVLLVPNHVSWFDWLFLGVCLDKDWRFVTSSRTAESSWLHRLIMVNRRTFPIDATSPYAVKRMAEYLEGNGRLVLFAEGRISPTGTLMKLFEGTGFLLYKTRARVITAYLRGAQRLPFAPHPGWRRLFPRVSVHYSAAMVPPRGENLSTAQARTRLTHWLRDQMVEQQFEVEMRFGPHTVPLAIVETARRQPKMVILEDVAKRVTYRRFLTAGLLLARRWEETLEESRRVGVLLPNVTTLPVVIFSLWSAGKVPAILNFSTGPATMLDCARLAGLRTVVTSRALLERLKLDLSGFEKAGIEILYLEDMEKVWTRLQKWRAYLAVWRNPQAAVLSRQFPKAAHDPAVILFTSGSEGVPKGVELSHRNLLANIRQMLAVTDLMDTDRVFNPLPLFHSFGLTVGTLLGLVRGIYVFVYLSPLHYRVVPSAFYGTNCTVLLGTNTFLNGYARKAHPYDFRSLRYLFAGAEKLQESTAETWMHRFGVRILEGYGATECSPCISVCTPLDPSAGTAGRLLPGLEARLEPVDGVEEGGRLLVRGPNVMLGYLNPEANAAFKSRGGWYDTGDIAALEEGDFVVIKGRLKRFAKVSGEMVSLTAVEEALAGRFPQYGMRCEVAVISRPDEDKGEVLVAVSNEPRLRLEEIRAVLRERGFSNLCVPKEVRVQRQIPKLGTGKVDHRALGRLLTQEPDDRHAPPPAAAASGGKARRTRKGR